MKQIPLRDRVTVGLLAFFVAIALTLELYWLRAGATLVADARTSFFARLFQIYGDCDRGYFDARSPLAVALEGINVYFTQALNLALLWAILKRRPWRHPLQLAVGAYLAYSVVLYFLEAQVAGYPAMRYRSLYTFGLFYGANLPWLAFNLWLVADSAVAITRRFAGDALAGEAGAARLRQPVSRGEAGAGRVVVDDEPARA